MQEQGSLDKKVSQYEPVDDSFSSQDLQRSYWFATHRVLLRNFAIATLVVADVMLIGYALSGFISYLATGQPREEAAVIEIAKRLGASNAEKQKTSAAIPLAFGDGRVYVFDAGDDRYDFAVEVQNSNKEWYVMLTYQYEISGQEPTATRTMFILPGEKKYLTLLGEKRPGQTVNEANLKITNELWSRISPHDVADVPKFIAEHATFEIGNPTFTEAGAITDAGVSEETGNRIAFSITNKTAFNFWSLPVQIVLMRGGSVEGIEETQVRELKTDETRVVDLRNYVKNQLVDEVQVIPSVDIFDASVYMQQ